jgi:hypothetical protein
MMKYALLNDFYYALFKPEYGKNAIIRPMLFTASWISLIILSIIVLCKILVIS